jgi:hypothetical protein
VEKKVENENIYEKLQGTKHEAFDEVIFIKQPSINVRKPLNYTVKSMNF